MFLAFIHIVTGNSTSFVFSCLNTILLSGYATLCLSIHQLGIWIVSSYWLPWIILRWSFLFSVTKLCQTLCDPMDCSMLGFPVLHYLPEFAQTHVHWVSDAIQPSHPLSSPYPPSTNLSQHQSLFQWVGSSHQVIKVLEFQLQHQSFQWIFRTDFLWINWCDLFAVQRTLRSLPKGPSSKVPFFGAELFL